MLPAPVQTTSTGAPQSITGAFGYTPPGAASASPSTQSTTQTIPATPNYSAATFNTKYQAQMPQIKQTVSQLQKRGIPSDQIFSYLQQKGVINMPGPATPSANGQSNGQTSNTFSDKVVQSGQNLSNELGQAGQNAISDITDIPTEAKNAGGSPLAYAAATGAALGHEAGNIAGTAGDILGSVISPLLPDSVKNAVGNAASWVGNKINSIPGMTPEIAKSLGDLFNTATLAGGGEAASSAGEGISSAADTVGKAVNDTAQSVKNSVKETITPNPETEALKANDQAIKDATPAYNKDLIGEPAVKNADGSLSPRINEGGALKNRTVNSKPSEIEAGKELAKTSSYDPKATNLEKFNAVQSEIAKEGKNLSTSLQNEKITRPPQEVSSVIKKAVNNASQNSLVLQKTDPIVKNYLRVANRAIAQNDGTLSGELGVRKALDNAYEDAGGKYSNNKGLDQIHRAARNAINDDLEVHAQSTEVKSSLKKQSNLYKASDVLQDKAKAEGGSGLERLQKAHPKITKAVKTVGRTVGLGGVITAAEHL